MKTQRQSKFKHLRMPADLRTEKKGNFAPKDRLILAALTQRHPRRSRKGTVDNETICPFPWTPSSPSAAAACSKGSQAL